MTNILYWFDCDFNLVHDVNWLDGVLREIALSVDCTAVWATAPHEGGRNNWSQLFKEYPPTVESILFMHGRTGRVDDVIDAMWDASGRDTEVFPRCRIVYSGGTEWDYLENRLIPNSLIRSCRVKGNDFKWSSEEGRGTTSEKFTRIVKKYIGEAKSKHQRTEDFLNSLAERVSEVGQIAAAAIINEEMAKDISLWQKAKISLMLHADLTKVQAEWLGMPLYEYFKLTANLLDDALANIGYKRKLGGYETNFDAVFQILYRGTVDKPALANLIREAKEELSNA